MLETRLNLLETEIVTLRQQIANHEEYENIATLRQKGILHIHEDTNTNLIFISTPSICNTGRSVDLRV